MSSHYFPQSNQFLIKLSPAPAHANTLHNINIYANTFNSHQPAVADYHKCRCFVYCKDLLYENGDL